MTKQELIQMTGSEEQATYAMEILLKNCKESVVRMAIRAELNSIDSCFVDGDAEGIRAILKKAEADPKLSTWNRLRIINECNSALLELHMQ